MKKLYLACVALITVCHASLVYAETLRITFSTPVITRRTTGDSITVPGASYWQETGKPAMPYTEVILALPPGTDEKDITVACGRTHRITEELHLRNSGNVIRIGNNDGDRESVSYYTGTHPYPDRWIVCNGLQYKQGIPCLVYAIFPVRYTAHDTVLMYITEVLFTYPDGAGIPVSVHRYDQFKSLVANPDSLKPVYREHYRNEMDTETEIWDYVIIAKSSLTNSHPKPNLSDLLMHRTYRGLNAKILSVEYITNRYSGLRPDGGTDMQTAIRHCIHDAVTNWNTRYVLLAGDDESIPARRVYAEYNGVVLDVASDGCDSNMPTDIYYSCLDGTYDYNANGVYGETNDGMFGGYPDVFADVSVGRLPAETGEEISVMVAKILAYENVFMTNEYCRRGLMVGEYLGNFPKPWGGDRMDLVKDGCTNAGMETIGFPGTWAVGTLYDRDYPGNQWTKEVIMDLINTGRYQLISHLGHAYYHVLMHMDRNDPWELVNPLPVFMYSEGCYAGAFDVDDAIAEELLKATNAAFSVIMNSRYGLAYEDSLHGPSDRFNRRFFNAIFEENLYCAGDAIAHSREILSPFIISDVNGGWVCYEITLFGDPATPLTQFMPEPTGLAVLIFPLLYSMMRNHADVLS